MGLFCWDRAERRCRTPVLVEWLEDRRLLSVTVSWEIYTSTGGRAIWGNMNAETGGKPVGYGFDENGEVGERITGQFTLGPQSPVTGSFASDGSVSFNGIYAASSIHGSYTTSV